jgi:hypothetical protein
MDFKLRMPTCDVPLERSFPTINLWQQQSRQQPWLPCAYSIFTEARCVRYDIFFLCKDKQKIGLALIPNRATLHYKWAVLEVAYAPSIWLMGGIVCCSVVFYQVSNSQGCGRVLWGVRSQFICWSKVKRSDDAFGVEFPNHLISRKITK